MSLIHVAQIFAAQLAETPANKMTPTIFCETIQQKFNNLENISIHIRDKEWAKQMGMNAFLSVAQGSQEPPKFLEVHYKPKGDEPIDIVFVGKGVTFDSGGISIKPSENMKSMKGDMSGAAVVMAAMHAIAKLGINLNIVALTPLCENLPSGNATKPGDVITAMNGKTIEVDNTDAEGRLILADALCYASTMSPNVIIDVATLTGLNFLF